jgi:peptide-methionine (S)-S-oxide reductase
MNMMGILSVLVFSLWGCENKTNPTQLNTNPMSIDTTNLSKATFGGGCFWCTEAIFKDLKGVVLVKSGYCGGREANPTYNEVAYGKTGHAESVQIWFDAEQISYETLLEVFFATHDPTTLNKQGNDVGAHYRSVVFYHDDLQKKAAEHAILHVATQFWSDPIVTELAPYEVFYIAENYHQDYFINNPNQPYCAYIINPKVQKFRIKYASLLKEN